MGGVGGQFRLNQHGQQDVPNKQKATGGYKHKPFTSISYSIAIMVCADTPKTALTRHTSDSKSREVVASPPPLPNAHFSRGLFPPPTPVARNQEKNSNVPPRQTQVVSLQPHSRTPNAGSELAKLSKSFSPVSPVDRPKIALFHWPGTH